MAPARRPRGSDDDPRDAAGRRRRTGPPPAYSLDLGFDGSPVGASNQTAQPPLPNEHPRHAPPAAGPVSRSPTPGPAAPQPTTHPAYDPSNYGGNNGGFNNGGFNSAPGFTAEGLRAPTAYGPPIGGPAELFHNNMHGGTAHGRQRSLKDIGGETADSIAAVNLFAGGPFFSLGGVILGICGAVSLVVWGLIGIELVHWDKVPIIRYLVPKQTMVVQQHTDSAVAKKLRLHEVPTDGSLKGAPGPARTFMIRGGGAVRAMAQTQPVANESSGVIVATEAAAASSTPTTPVLSIPPVSVTNANANANANGGTSANAG